MKGYDRGRMKADLAKWLDKHRAVHTCNGAVMPVFLGAEAYLKENDVEDTNAPAGQCLRHAQDLS